MIIMHGYTAVILKSRISIRNLTVYMNIYYNNNKHAMTILGSSYDDLSNLNNNFLSA